MAYGGCSDPIIHPALRPPIAVSFWSIASFVLLAVFFRPQVRLYSILMEDVRELKEFVVKHSRVVCFSGGGQYFAFAHNAQARKWLAVGVLFHAAQQEEAGTFRSPESTGSQSCTAPGLSIWSSFGIDFGRLPEPHVRGQTDLRSSRVTPYIQGRYRECYMRACRDAPPTCFSSFLCEQRHGRSWYMRRSRATSWRLSRGTRGRLGESVHLLRYVESKKCRSSSLQRHGLSSIPRSTRTSLQTCVVFTMMQRGSQSVIFTAV